MAICRGTIIFDKEGYDMLRVDMLVYGKHWDIISTGDYICQSLDLRNMPRAFNACREAHRARARQFYFCDMRYA